MGSRAITFVPYAAKVGFAVCSMMDTEHGRDKQMQGMTGIGS